MSLKIERIMTLVVLLASLLCVISSTASSLPLAVNDLNKAQEDPQGDHKVSSPKPPLRHIRETSETVSTASTTTASLPPDSTTEPPTEVCDETTRVQRGCKNLKELLLEYLRLPSPPSDTTVNSFMIQDLMYFDLLGNGSTEEQEETDFSADEGREICSRTLTEKYSNLRQSSGNCNWHYTCDFDFNRFPRVRIQAELDSNSGRHCEAVHMRDVPYFKRRPCNNDPCGRSTWGILRYREGNIIGYEDNSS